MSKFDEKITFEEIRKELSDFAKERDWDQVFVAD